MRTKVCIEIPKEFEEHFSKDRFEDSLHRLNADAHLLAGNYEQETVVMLINAFKNAYAIDDDDGELVCACGDCPFNEPNTEDD